jgi:hypothetical protein
MERIKYFDWPNCVRLSNDEVDLVATTDVGPRIIRFGFVGAENEFRDDLDLSAETEHGSWRIYGGHRLWHAPEASPRTYWPDNGPVEAEEDRDAIVLRQPVEKSTGIRKEMAVSLATDAARVEVTHRLVNENLWEVSLAPWALTVMAQGGSAVVPLPPRGEHPRDLLPVSTVTMWSYTDMTDPRWTWGERFVMLRQDPGAKRPQKAGFSVPGGWAAYARDGHLFVKRFGYNALLHYPDMGANVEAFTNAEMLELETLGATVRLAPGGSVEHVERWYLFRDVPTPASEAEVAKHVLPLIESTEP